MKRFVHLAAIWTVLASALAGATLNLVSSSDHVLAGETFTVDVNVTDVADLYAYQFDLGFDPYRVNAVTVSAGSFLGGGGLTLFIPGFEDNAAGILSATAESLQSFVPGVWGSGTLARITFLAMGPGQATLSPFAVSLLDSSLAEISTTAPIAEVMIGDVPEPSSGMTMGGAVVLLAVAFCLRGRSCRTAPGRL